MRTTLDWIRTSERLPDKPWLSLLTAYEQPDGEIIVGTSCFWNDGFKEVDLRNIPPLDHWKYNRAAEPTFWAELPRNLNA